jgi:hypothetical protein
MRQNASWADSPARRVDLEAFADAAFEAVAAWETQSAQRTSYIWEIGGATRDVSCTSPIFGRIIERALGPGLRRVTDCPRPDRFKIHCVDCAGAGAHLRPPFFDESEPSSPTPIRRLWLSADVRVGHQVEEDILTVVDLRHRRALVQVPNAATLPYHEQAAPMRSLLQWLTALNGGSLIHGAVIGTARGGVLLAGRGGSGKSSVALAGLAAGMHFAGDDYVLVDARDPPFAYGVYATAKVERGDLNLYAHLDAEFHDPTGAPEEKGVLFLNGELPGFRAGLRLRAIVLPRISRDPMRLRPCSPAQALRALAPSTLLQMSGDRRQLFDDCAKLVRRLPSFVLDTGPRTEHFGEDMAHTIGRLVDTVANK